MLFYLHPDTDPRQCCRCGGELPPGVVLVERRHLPLGSRLPDYFHPTCALDVSATAMVAALRRGQIAFPEREWVAHVARQRAELLREIAAAHAKVLRGQPVEACVTPIAQVEQARDPLGRPRVSVVVGGDATDALAGALTQHCADDTLTTPRREYVIAAHNPRAPQYLPWQPFVGGVIVVASGAPLDRLLPPVLVRWKALGIGAPVICVVGARGAATDRMIVALREVLDSAGFVGDEAAVLETPAITAEALAELGARFDEHFVDRAPPAVVDDRRVDAAAMLRAVVREQRVEGYAAALANAQRLLRGTGAEIKRELAADAVACLAYPPARGSALALLKALADHPVAEPLRAALPMLLAAQHPLADSHVAAAVALLERWKEPTHAALLAEALMAEPWQTLRHQRFARLLADCARAEVGEALAAWAQKLPARDRRRAEVLALADAIARAAATA